MGRAPDVFMHIATAGEASHLFSDILPWLLLLIAFVVIGGVVLFLIRRTINAPAEGGAEPFTLHGLRTMRDTGQITDDEFEKARAAMINRLTSAGAESSEEDAATARTADEGSEPGNDQPPHGRESGNDEIDRNDD